VNTELAQFVVDLVIPVVVPVVVTKDGKDAIDVEDLEMTGVVTLVVKNVFQPVKRLAIIVKVQDQIMSVIVQNVMAQVKLHLSIVLYVKEER
jgi:hypothetical protein